MNFKKSMILVAVGITTVVCGGENKNEMPSLQSFATLQQLTERMKSTEGIRRFPPAADRKSWDKWYRGDFQSKYTYAILDKAPKILNTPWPDCSLKLYTQYIKTGSRTAYQNQYSEKRIRLTQLAIAECIENRGRYIEEIAEGMWQIISEPTWAYPAHERFNAPDPVPIAGEYEVVDLGAAETGIQLATIIELLEPQLLAYSPSLLERIKKELIRRVIVPLEAEDDEPWWLRKVIYSPSNWVPWCCSNSFGTAVYVLKNDPERLAKLTWKMFAAVDKFIGVYMPDGACDEGPGYWRHSVAQMFQFMDQVNHRTNGLYNDFFKQPKIRRMGEFIADLNLTGNYFMNYADAHAKIKDLDYGILYAFGESINSDILKSFSLKFAELNKSMPPNCNSFLPLLYLFRLPFKADLSSYSHGEYAFYPDRQLFIARENAKNPEKGFIVSLKGGHNDEGHNHNDIGQFSVFLDGKPLIIDVGAGTYTRKTFSLERYSIWWLSGMGHNAAIINGNMQQQGKQYFATVRQVNAENTNPNITLDLSAIHPASTDVREYLRTLELNRKNSSVTISESLTMKNDGENTVEITLYSPEKVVSFTDKQLKWQNAVMNLENISCTSIKEVDLKEEKGLVETWGKIYCITLTGKFKNKTEWKMEFASMPQK